VIAVDRKTGKTRWQTETKTFFAGYSTPCVYQAEGDRAELILGEPSYATPAVAGGVMYLRTSFHIFSLGGPR